MCQELVSTEHAQLAVLHTWIRCIVLSHAHALSCDDHVTELTRLLPNLRLVSSLLIEEVSVVLIVGGGGEEGGEGGDVVWSQTCICFLCSRTTLQIR